MVPFAGLLAALEQIPIRAAAKDSVTALPPCCCLRCWPSWPAPPPTAASACSSACIASG